MQIETTSIEGVLLLMPKRFGDARGFFSEVWKKSSQIEAGIDVEFVQDNQSLSAAKGTVRGLHYQSPPHAQDKLVRCGAGALLDVVVDIRKSSPTYGQHVAVELSAENGRQIFVPKGFLHGFSTLESNTEILYKCSDYYAPDCDGSVRFDSPSLAIDWQVPADEVVLSDKDKLAPLFEDFQSPFD